MSELTGDFQHELMHELPAKRARETLAPWRRRLTALRTNEFVVRFAEDVSAERGLVRTDPAGARAAPSLTRALQLPV